MSDKDLRLKTLNKALLSDSKLNYILSQCTYKNPEDVIHDFTGVPITTENTRVGDSFGDINIHYTYHERNDFILNDYIEIKVLCGTNLCLKDKNDIHTLYDVPNLHLIIAQSIYDILHKTFSDIKDIKILNDIGVYTSGLPYTNSIRLFVKFE